MYARLGLDSSHGGGGGGRASAREQEDDLELVGGGGAGEPFVIKVIFRESSREVVPPMTPTSTVGALRAAASEMFDVELERVRLIQGGKILAPDSASLKSLHLVSGTSVHLFPKVNPAAASAGAGALPVATAASLQVAPTPTNDAAPALPFFHVDPAATLENLHIDPLVAQTCREVRLWSLILFFLSSMSIVNNLSELSNTGRLGSSKLDTVVLWLETACSVLGIYTAQLGLVSARTADLGAVSRYVKALTATALLCIAYRVVWTVDVVIEVKRILSMGAVALGSTQGGGGGAGAGAGPGSGSGSGASPGSGAGGSNSGPAGAGAKSSVQQLGGDDDGIAQASKDRILETYTLRAVMVALVCIGCWVSCWLRGVRLRLLLQAYSDSVAVPPTATATAVTNPIARVAAVGAAEQA